MLWTFYNVPILSEQKVCEICDRQTDRRTNVTKMTHVSWWNVFNNMCGMGRRLFRSGFDLNRSSFQLSRYRGYYAQTRLLGPIFSLPVTSTFDLYTPNLLRRLLVSRLYQSTKFSVSTALRFPVNRRHGTDWQTRETINAVFSRPY